MVSILDKTPSADAPPKGWVGVDFDGTLARYDEHRGISVIGKPIEAMVSRIKQWLGMDIEVRIFTARACEPELVTEVQDWLETIGLPRLPITNQRDLDLMQVWDDRVVQVETNTGEIFTPRPYLSLEAAGWIGVELDGTLAHYEKNQQRLSIGEPVAKMHMRVKQWLMVGIDVRLFTARAADPQMLPVITAWLKQHHLEKMKLTFKKDFAMSQFWDDRGIHVVSNTGEIAAPSHLLSPTPKYPV
jgi:hypothetical protein